jgi:hypothetical protein
MHDDRSRATRAILTSRRTWSPLSNLRIWCGTWCNDLSAALALVFNAPENNLSSDISRSILYRSRSGYMRYCPLKPYPKTLCNIAAMTMSLCSLGRFSYCAEEPKAWLGNCTSASVSDQDTLCTVNPASLVRPKGTFLLNQSTVTYSSELA